MLPSDAKVAIIGGGVSGLAQADILKQIGYNVVVYESRKESGGVWAANSTYAGVALQSPYFHYHLSSLPWKETGIDHAQHPTAPQIRDYMKFAWEKIDVDLRLGREVKHVRQIDGDSGWYVMHCSSKDTYMITERFDYIVVAAGLYCPHHKIRPLFDGEDTFDGQILSEQDVQDPNIFRNKHVVVLGFGKSAIDMNMQAMTNGALSVNHVFRTSRWMMARTVLGIPFKPLLFKRVHTLMMPCWSHLHQFERFLHHYLGFIVRWYWAIVGAIVTLGHNAWQYNKRLNLLLKPDLPLMESLRSSILLAPENFVASVAIGKIIPHRASVKKLIPGFVELSNGTSLKADIFVLATGSSSTRFPYLPEEVRSQLLFELKTFATRKHMCFFALCVYSFRIIL